MANRFIHQCECAKCNDPEPNPTKDLHFELNCFLSTLDEKQRLLFLGMESMNPGYGGDQQLELITGVKATMIAKMRWGYQQTQISHGYPYLSGRFPMEKAKLPNRQSPPGNQKKTR